jgi:ADP-ribose pyrophosphatase
LLSGSVAPPGWKTIGRSTVARFGKFLTLETHRIELPDGRIIEDWPWVITPDFVIVVPVTRDGKVLCFRQWKYGVDGPTLAPVGGYREEGEDPLACAQRELKEETGCDAERWVSLGSFRVDSNRGAGTAYFYLALGAVKKENISSDDLEEQELMTLSVDEIEESLDRGLFKVVPWTAAVALAVRRLRSGGSTPMNSGADPVHTRGARPRHKEEP